MKALILAGGLGIRLRPLTLTVPKPMVPFCNQPLLLHLVRHLQSYHISEVIFLLFYRPEAIQDFFGDGSKYGFQARYVVAGEDYGTAGAVKHAAKYVDGTSLIVSGDILTDVDYARLVAVHRQKKAMMSMGLTRVEDPTAYGNVVAGPSGRILRFVEKPSREEEVDHLINTGVYVIEPDLLEQIAGQRPVSFEHDVFPTLIEENSGLYGVELAGYWRDLGIVDQYLAAHVDAVLGNLSEFVPAAERTGPEGVLVGDGSRLEPGAVLRRSVVGRRCRISSAALLERVVLWDDVDVGEGSRLRHCVMGAGCIVGPYAVVDELAVIGERSILGRGCAIGRGVRIRPGARIDAGERIVTSSES